MKVVNISGGLGNQMFQYAFALYLKNEFPQEEIYLDTSHYHTLFFKHYKGINLHNGFELSNLFPKACLPVAGFKELRKVSYYVPNYVLSRIARKYLPLRKSEYIEPFENIFLYDGTIANMKGNCYYEGYWQCPEYFNAIKGELNEIFVPSEPNEYNRSLIREIENTNSIGIHVRRGDYLKEPEYADICNLEYYKKAIEKVVTTNGNHCFFIFSNDLDWCKENLMPLIGGNKVVFANGNKGKDSYWDMFLMTYCKSLIIANSSFSWWGAYLGRDDRRIVAPYPWSRRKCKIDIYDKSWTLIEK